MPLRIAHGLPAILIRKEAFERAGLIRSDLDARFNLTDEEFRVEGPLIGIGPLPSDDMIGTMTEYLEAQGLSYFEDFFELGGNWPGWLGLYVMGA